MQKTQIFLKTFYLEIQPADNKNGAYTRRSKSRQHVLVTESRWKEKMDLENRIPADLLAVYDSYSWLPAPCSS